MIHKNSKLTMSQFDIFEIHLWKFIVKNPCMKVLFFKAIFSQ